MGRRREKNTIKIGKAEKDKQESKEKNPKGYLKATKKDSKGGGVDDGSKS